MTELIVADRASEWRRLKALVLDSVSSPITKRVYNLGLDEFIAWYTAEPRPAGFTKATQFSPPGALILIARVSDIGVQHTCPISYHAGQCANFVP